MGAREMTRAEVLERLLWERFAVERDAAAEMTTAVEVHCAGCEGLVSMVPAATAGLAYCAGCATVAGLHCASFE